MRSKISAVLSLFFLSMTLIGCGGTTAPEDIPGVFIKAVASGDTDTIRKLANGKAAEEGLKMAALAEDNNITISDFKVLSSQAAADGRMTVKVEYVSKTETKSGRGFPRSLKNFQTFHLVESEQGWTVQEISVDRPPLSVT
jgi:predicted component of type VI protein secretion system